MKMKTFFVLPPLDLRKRQELRMKFAMVQQKQKKGEQENVAKIT